MEEQVRQIAVSLLREGKVAGVVGLKREHGQVGPHVFTVASELEHFVLLPKYAVSKLAIRLAPKNRRLAIVARGCDERTLIELAKINQVNLSNLEIIGVACSKDLSVECRCDAPFPSKIAVGEKVEGVEDPLMKKLLAMTLEERNEFWTAQFLKCQKCYGCRNACPLCACNICELEQPMWVPKGVLPPESPTYHLIRAFHLADKCAGCCECERACPVAIPLKTLQSMLAGDMEALFGYEMGADERPSPLLTSLEECPLKGGVHD